MIQKKPYIVLSLDYRTYPGFKNAEDEWDRVI
jgi:hypothetical protein